MLDLFRRLAHEATRVILDVYSTPFDVEYKGPGDPVTLADQRVNELIVRALDKEFPGVPVVAEESHASQYAGFAKAKRAFFLDPVDGTNEFVKKTGEFCMMLGYIEDGRPVAGVIAAPVLGKVYMGQVGQGARVYAADGSSQPLAVASHLSLEQALAVVSRSHHSHDTEQALRKLRVARSEPYGSAGLKAMRIADGSAQVYLHAGYAGQRWDSAAPEAIARAAGASYTDMFGAAYRYDEEELANARGVLALPESWLTEALARLAGTRPLPSDEDE